jgi:polysaccharide deacetylase 2 family uncharacterized protein YibQ
MMLPIAIPKAVAGVLSLFLLAFALWAFFAEDPLGGEPIAVVSLQQRESAQTAKADASAKAAATPGASRYDGPAAPAAPGAPQTVTIIDGSSGKRQEVTLPVAGAARSAAPPAATAPTASGGEPRLLEATRHGAIPRISADGARPADVYARPVKLAGGGTEGPRVAIVISGLGIGASGTAEALSKLPAPITFAFAPYGSDLERHIARARNEGHEVVLQVPMEPLDYPDSDPGPKTLLTSLAPDQNIDRLHWLMSRFQGYVGISNYMGGRFTASEQAIGPVLRETAQRGLLYLDDGSSPRSVAGQIAGANNVAFAKAEIVIDSLPMAADIDKALARLEAMARERGTAVGIASALPITIERIAQWSRSAQSRGITLVPISGATLKSKSS